MLTGYTGLYGLTGGVRTCIRAGGRIRVFIQLTFRHTIYISCLAHPPAIADHTGVARVQPNPDTLEMDMIVTWTADDSLGTDQTIITTGDLQIEIIDFGATTYTWRMKSLKEGFDPYEHVSYLKFDENGWFPADVLGRAGVWYSTATFAQCVMDFVYGQ